MLRRLTLLYSVAACGLMSPSAFAEWRCDCTTIIDSCSADVTVQETFVEITAPGAQCARVDYFIDGMPFVSVAVDGGARENWIARGAEPRVLVRGCQVCVDNAGLETTAAPASAEPPAELAPLVAPEPAYPREAQLSGIEGSVTVEFTVNPYGDTQDVTVVSSRPAGVFDLTAVSAVSRWRYPADGEREPVDVTETLEFTIDDFLFDEVARPQAQAAAARGQPNNRCIRENVTWNYGEMIEIGLISACSEPQAVFACAPGTGSNAQRWVCSSTEDNGTVLVPPGDSRRGFDVVLPSQTGQSSFAYAEDFFVARAPNSEYWWIACAGDDTRCRDAARQWSAALDRQAAQMNPQLRTQLEVARSY